MPANDEIVPALQAFIHTESGVALNCVGNEHNDVHHGKPFQDVTLLW